MNWTKELPTKDGYYWWRKYKFKSNSIYYVFNRDGVVMCRWAHSGLYDKETVKEVGGEWYGPLVGPDDGGEILDSIK